MDLLKLGAQARKTGLKPRSNVAKDKYDMEDVDEFFEETTWSDSKQSEDPIARESLKPTILKNGEYTHEISTTIRKNLGVGRIRDNRSELKILLVKTHSETKDLSNSGLNENLDSGSEYPDYAEMNEFGGFDEIESPQVKENEESSEQAGGFDLTQDPQQSGEEHKDLGNDMTLSPIPLLSLKGSGLLQSPLSSPLPQPERSLSNAISAGSFTKSMVLRKTKKRPRIIESDHEDSARETAEDQIAYLSSDAAGAFDSDFMQSLYSQTSSYKPSQANTIRPSPLPSPPPEGLRRSKRTKIAPLAYWRNERIVYSRALEAGNADPDSTLVSDIRKIPLQEISEVVHIPEAQKKKSTARRGRPPKNATTTGRGRKSNLKLGIYDYESDPEIEGSEWFKDKSLEAEVFQSEDSRIKRVVAWSPEGGNFLSPPAGKNGQLGMDNFKVAPLFDSESEMIAAGLLEFPVDGFKSLRTTGESLFIFHVANGLIEVTLNSEKFVVTRGCSFEIPKLNIYSFKNIGQGSARLFFVQCQLG